MTLPIVLIIAGFCLVLFVGISVFLLEAFERGDRGGIFGAFYGGIIYVANSVGHMVGGLGYTVPISLVVALLWMFISFPNTWEWLKDKCRDFGVAISDGLYWIATTFEERRQYRKLVKRAQKKAAKTAPENPSAQNISDDIFD